MAAKKTEGQASPETMVTFGKERILRTKRYANRVDLLGVLLEDGREYTFSEVDNLLEKFMSGGGN